MPIQRAMLAEFVGTFALMFVGGGAIIAAWLLNLLMSAGYEVGNLGATLGAYPAPADGGVAHPFLAVGLEIIATFFLMFMVMGTAVDGRGVGKNAAIGGLGIGLILTACILAIGPLTGASLNPARSFGPALIARTWDFHWVYWAAPIAGALAAAFAYLMVFALEG